MFSMYSRYFVSAELFLTRRMRLSTFHSFRLFKSIFKVNNVTWIVSTLLSHPVSVRESEVHLNDQVLKYCTKERQE